MWEKIRRLRNINNTLYIYATQSGILLITSDLKYYYYSVFLDMEPKYLGLFQVPYPKTENQAIALEAEMKFSTKEGYGIPIFDGAVFDALKSFEAENAGETTEAFDMRYALYQVMCARLLKFTTNSAEHKPFTRHICIDTKDFTASLAATDCKTLCVFGEIPIATGKTDAVKYIISKEMATAVMGIGADLNQIVTFSKMRKSPEGEYRIQAMSGDYLFVEKQSIHIYPTYQETINYYNTTKSEQYRQFPIIRHNKTKVLGLPIRELSDQKLVKSADLLNELLSSNSATSEVLFDIEFIERVLANVASSCFMLTMGTDREMMQIFCGWGKEEKYTQYLCVMPVNPEFIQAKEKSPTNSDEPISSCNLKTIKNVI